jgi:outer membrane protein assembly factor BamB
MQVIVNGANKARSYDLSTGELMWEYGEKPGVDAIPSPMRLDDLAIFLSGLQGDPVYAVPLGSSGDLSNTDRLAWRHGKGGPQISSAVLLGNRLFFIKGRTGVLTCLDARTGAVIIDQQRLAALNDIYASAVAAAGRVYFTGRNGTTVVLDAATDEVRILAENHLTETSSASPAIVGREIFLRGEKNLYCIAL